ncbi:MAG: hypothetical protein ACJ76H_02660 [Bacteriovoracaceae bacterium]
MTRKSKLVTLLCFYAVIGASMLMLRTPGTLDTRLYYTNAEALQWISSLSPEMKETYLWHQYLDLGYLITYSLIAYLFLGYWALIPGVLDLFETIFILLHLERVVMLPEFLGIVTCLKWISGVIVILLGIFKLTSQRFNRAS